MANYNYTALGVLGFFDQTSIKARVGLGLLQKIVKYGSSGVAAAQDPEFPAVVLAPLPKGFKCWIHAHSALGTQPTGATDWAGFASGTDLDTAVICDVADPAFTATSPAPTLAAWCAAYGGTVDQSGGM